MRLAALLLCLAAAGAAAQIPVSGDFPADKDLSAEMVAGIDRFALGEIAKARELRSALWPGDAGAHREQLKKIIGAVDARVAPGALEFVADTESASLLLETEQARISRVRWKVFEGVHGEGVLIQPRGRGSGARRLHSGL